jgi:uncharacterized Zn-finger protein
MDIMKLHEKTHLDVKPHRCDVCDKSFTQLTNMLNHKKTHEKEPEFKCEACDAGFRKQTSLIKHLKVHTGVKAFVCEICEKSFDLPSSLKVCTMYNVMYISVTAKASQNPHRTDAIRQCDAIFQFSEANLISPDAIFPEIL